jgi:hypothetical protein
LSKGNAVRSGRCFILRQLPVFGARASLEIEYFPDICLPKSRFAAFHEIGLPGIGIASKISADARERASDQS